ncbi:MAG: hypothetical protein FJZ64_01400 [Chlamydiae bacterium]|nr:hypothetical protein [Chlamydiota bacterium]
MTTQLDHPQYDNSSFLYHLPQIYRSVLKDFKKVIQSVVFFHLFFISLISLELFFFLPFITYPAALAFAIGALFLSSFTYFVLFFYFQARKPEKLSLLLEIFLQSCRRHLSIPSGEPQHHLCIADALSRLAVYLADFEKNFYQIPSFFQPFAPLLRKFSVFCYRKDVFQFKYLLLKTAIQEHLEQIRLTPIDLELHASLASTYVTLSKLFQAEMKKNSSFEEKFKMSTQRAIEEFQIMNAFAPNDPWIHEQLAKGYHDLERSEEELKEVEFLLKLRPQDPEILFRLGELYFHQGMNAKGLQTYETLKQMNFKKAEELIASYGLFTV